MTTSHEPAASSTWNRLARLRPMDAVHSVAIIAVLAAGEYELRRRALQRTAARRGIRFLETEGELTDEGGPEGALRLTRSEQRWIANARRVLKRWPLDRTCLRQSLLIGWILRRRQPLLVLGVRRADGAFAAHAWIRINGLDLDAGADEYATFG